jgi:hypothetical protein
LKRKLFAAKETETAQPMFVLLLLLLLLIVIVIDIVVAQTIVPTLINETVTMGTSQFTIVKEIYARWPTWTTAMCPRPIRFVNLHLNEITSIRAARRFFQQEPCGGHLVFVTRPGGNVRNLDWMMSTGQRFSVDPNRIFSQLQIDKETGGPGTLAGELLPDLRKTLLFFCRFLIFC